jgi:hypothetical protein
MRDKLAAVAKDNKRSVNAEVVARLEWSFDPTAAARFISDGDTTISLDELMRKIYEGVAEERARKHSGKKTV